MLALHTRLFSLKDNSFNVTGSGPRDVLMKEYREFEDQLDTKRSASRVCVSQ